MTAVAERAQHIEAVTATADYRLQLQWSDGRKVEINFRPFLKRRAFRALENGREFLNVRVGDWGYGLEWPSGAEIGADSLWLETLSATGQKNVRTFLEWRLCHGLSLTKAAEALGISRRMVAYYSSGEKLIPRHILLACLGWEVASDPEHREPTLEQSIRDLAPA